MKPCYWNWRIRRMSWEFRMGVFVEVRLETEDGMYPNKDNKETVHSNSW